MTLLSEITAFTANLTAAGVLAAVAEFLVPPGPLKSTVSTAVGLVFTSIAADQVLGIIGRMGV